ncbi:MAG TPA: thioesterase family protein [Polyangiaceae bacterium]|nr:thioesterase family protein [Polyangiaceae bacterium]
MNFSDLLRSMVQEDGLWHAEVPASWLQGRSAFGGLQAALMLRAMRGELAAALPLRAFQTAFVAPVPGGPVRLRARALRVGKNVTQIEARIVEGDTTLALGVGVFGQARSSLVRVTPTRPPDPSKEPISLSYVEDLMPTFHQNFDVKWLDGAMLYTGSTSTKAVISVGIRDEGPMTEEHVLAIADWPPPLAMSFLTEPTNGSSVTWTVEMLTESVSSLPMSGYRLDAELVAAGNGYTSQSVMVWGPDGSPVALSRQSMVIFG